MGITKRGRVIFKSCRYLILALGLGAWSGQALRCADVYQTSLTQSFDSTGAPLRNVASLLPSGTLRRQEFKIDYRESESFEILRIVNRIQNEYPREWLNRAKEYTEIIVPESRWTDRGDLFRWTFQEVIRELSASEIFRTNIYQDGYKEITLEGRLLKGYEIRKGSDGKNHFVFRIDPRIIKLVDFHLEPAVANRYLENGLFRTRVFPEVQY